MTIFICSTCYSIRMRGTNKAKRVNIAISLENYLYLKGLGKTADSFNRVLTSVLVVHRDKLRQETKTLQSDPQVCPPGKQIASVATHLRGDNVNG
jgi:heterodisulfide reductase subunit C